MFLRSSLIWSPAAGLVPLAAMFLAGLAIGAGLGLSWPGSERASPAIAAPVSGSHLAPLRLAPGGHPVEVLRVNDGDTFEARVHIWPGMQVTTKVRLRGIDAPELNARCAEEYRRASAAKDGLRDLLSEGAVSIARVDFDKYGGRVVADVATRHTPNVSDALLRAGLARSYGGGRRESWCGVSAAR